MRPTVATAKPKRKKHLKFFYDHDDQDAKDLLYGGQKDDCKKYLKKDTAFEDHSTDGTWTPDED